MPLKSKKIAENADGIFIRSNKFNTTLISFNFYLPLSEETVAEYALLPFVLTTCGKKYPDFSELNFRLLVSKLYVPSPLSVIAPLYEGLVKLVIADL